MAIENIDKCKIDGLYIIKPKIFYDNRGYFMETYNYNEFSSCGLDMTFVQDNQSKSEKGVLRGLHFQKEHPQGKLVRVLKGEVFDVAVDIRNGSKTYGEWCGVILSEENKKQFYISPGFAHGFLVLSDTAEFAYKCTDFYHPEDESGIAWNDPDINVEWPTLIKTYDDNTDALSYSLMGGASIKLSLKDQKWKKLREIF